MTTYQTGFTAQFSSNRMKKRRHEAAGSKFKV